MADPISIGGKAAASAGATAGGKTLGQIGLQAAGFGLQYIGGRLMGDGRKKTFSDPEDLKVQGHLYGQPVPIVYGSAVIAGQILWVKNNSIDEKWVGSGKKGKGGKGKASGSGYMQRRATFAIGVCEGPAVIARIVADTKVIYDNRAEARTAALNRNFAPVKHAHEGINFFQYTGDTDQEPDPRIEADIGVGNVPAFRGLCYVVFDDLNLEEFGNRIPNFTFEVYSSSTTTGIGGEYILTLPNGNTIIEQQSTSLDPHRPVAYISATAGVWKLDLYSKANYSWVGFESVDISEHSTGTGTATATFGGRVQATSDGRLLWGAAVDFHSVLVMATANGQVVDVGAAKTGPVSSNGGEHDVFMFDVSQANYDSISNIPFSNRRFAFQFGGKLICWEIIGDTVNFRGQATVTGGIAFGLAVRPPLAIGETHTVFALSGQNDLLGWKLKAFKFYQHEDALNTEIVDGIGDDADGLAWEWSISDSPAPMGADGAPIGRIYAIAWLEEIDKLLVLGWDGRAHKVDPTDGTVEETSQHPDADGGTLTVNALQKENWIMQGLGEHGMRGGTYKFPLKIGTTIHYAPFDVFSWEWGPAADSGGQSSTREKPSYDPWGDSFIYLVAAAGSQFRRSFPGAVSPDRVTLRSVLSDIMDRAGYDSGDYSVLSIPTSVDLEGYVLSREVTGDKAIEPLLADFQVSTATIDGVMTFKPLSFSASLRTISDEDFAASEGTSDDELNLVKESKLDGQEIPRVLHLEFQDPNRNYDPNVVRAFRDPTAVTGDDVSTIRTPVVYTATEASQVAWRRLKALHSGKTTIEWDTGRAHADLAPLDIVTVERGNAGYDYVRIDSQEYGETVSFKGSVVNPKDYTALGAGILANHDALIIPMATTEMFLVDSHIFRGTDDNSGHYAFIGKGEFGASWVGGVLWQSAENVTWEVIQGFSTGASHGVVSASSLGSFTYGWDFTSTITLRMVQGAPETKTELEVLNGANVALWEDEDGEWEIIQWVTASYDSGTDTYTLSQLRRGKLGTEQFLTHSNGSRFVIVQTNAGVARIADNKDVLRYYVASTLGKQPTFEDSQAFTNTGKGLRPYAPTSVAAVEDGSSNIDVTWLRRTRYDGEWKDLTESVPLNEDSEAYKVRVKDTSGNVIRGPVDVSTTTWQYTSAMRATDGTDGASGSPVYTQLVFEVTQVSASYGEGLAGSVTFDL